MAHQIHIKSEKYRQWVKAGLGLGYLKEGLAPFCDDIAKQQHNDILDNIKRTKTLPTIVCGTCTLKNLQPDHVKLGNKQCPLRHTNCNCCYTAGKNPCPKHVCGAIYDSIISYHASTPPAPNWKNTQTQQWTADPWSIAKCFINAPGYEKKTSAADTDCTGLLHVIINNKYFHNHVSCNMTLHNVFSKVRQYRNEIFHSSTQELGKLKTNNCIDDMIAVLQDGKELIHRQDAQEAVKRLQDLKEEAFIITVEDVEKVLGDIRDDLSLMKGTTEGLANDNEGQKRKIASLESKTSELEEDITYLKDNTAKKKMDHESLKTDLQQKLIEEYRQNVLKVPAMPCQPEHLCNFKDVYVTPMIIIKSKDNDKKDIETEVKPLSDIFIRNNKHLKSIYILGEAGSGKSSFCKMLVNCWCMAHSDTQYMDDQVEENTEEKGKLLKVMMKFDFLFFLPLRLYTDKTSIEDMLENVYRHRVLKELLEKESEKCLIVLDGLDEWRHKSISTCPQQRTLSSNYTVITTSRPWKIGSLNMEDNEMQQSFHINGFGFESKNKLITKTVNILNKTFQKDKDPQKCADALINSNSLDMYILTQTAMMLQQLICLWFDDKLLATSKCKLYTNMLDLFFVWHKKKAPVAPLFIELLKKSHGLDLLELFDNTDECKLHSYIVQGVSRLAYETLMKNAKETSLTFDSSLFQKLNISNDIKDCCLELGILSEEKGPSLSASSSRKSHISFIHKSIQEYLAALYIVLNTNSGQELSLDSKQTELSEYLSTMLNVKTLDEVLEQENVLIMLCGLEPRVVECISKFIHDIVARDERVLKYRTTIVDKHEYAFLVPNIQRLILGCIKETKASKKLQNFSLDLRDLMFYRTSSLLKCVAENNITLDSVRSFNIQIMMLEKGDNDLGRTLECMTRCKNLEAIKLECKFDQDVCQRLCDSIESNATSLKCLSLEDDVTLHLFNALRRPLFRNIANMTHLVALKVKWLTVTHEDFASLCAFLSDTGNLQQISIYINCECKEQHEVDLSKHKQLQYLEYKNPVVVTNAVCTNLVVIKCLSSMNEINCIKIFDLLSNSMKIKEIDINCDRFSDISITNRLDQNYYYTTITSKLTHVISLSQQLRELTLNYFTFTDNIITCPSEMKSLESIDISNVTMSLTTWRKFVDSVALLPQRVEVSVCGICITRDGEECNHDIDCFSGGGEEAAAFQYVREREALFDALLEHDHFSGLTFSRKT